MGFMVRSSLVEQGTTISKIFIWHPKGAMEKAEVAVSLKKIILLKEVRQQQNKTRGTSEDPTDFIFYSKFFPRKGEVFT